MLFTFPAETASDTSETNRFRTYLNYLESIKNFLDSEYNCGYSFADSFIPTKAFHSIQGGKCGSPEKIEKCLRNAWFTEVQIAFPAQFPQFVHYANHWVCVQAYYSCYLALRALFYSKGIGDQIGVEHASNLKCIAEEIKGRGSLFPAPFNVLCAGDPAHLTAVSYINLPPGVEIAKVSSLTSSTNVDFWNSFGMLLRTTRKRILTKVCEDWKKSKGLKRMCPKQKQVFLRNLPPTSLFHVFYRMRIRSNYNDADSFLMSIVNSRESVVFYESQRTILWYLLFLIESLTAKYLGKGQFSKMVDGFLEHETTGFSDELVGKRRELFLDKW